MTTPPADQRLRIRVLRLVTGLAFLPLVLFTRPLLGPGWAQDLLTLTGTLLVIAAVLGRFWAILYIGALKNREVMQDGPYSICRHPLYLFSTLGVAGFGLLLGSLSVAAVMMLAIFAILSRTAAREEEFLCHHFGDAYAAYAARVPRIVPRLYLLRSESTITVSIRPLKMTYRDALVFLGFLPLALLVGWLRDAQLLPMIALP